MMKTKKTLFFCIMLLLLSLGGMTQNSNLSKWIIDQNNVFSCQNITFSELSDTVIFENNVNLKLEFIEVEGAKKVLYLKRLKRLIILPSLKNDFFQIKGNNSSVVFCSSNLNFANGDSTQVNWFEYTLGEKVVVVK